MKKTTLIVLLMLAAAVILSACASGSETQPAQAPVEPVVEQATTAPDAKPSSTEEGAGIANPASQYCVEQGGSSFIAEGPIGQYGICTFEDNLQCEEWAMMRGDCPVGGIKVTGYITEAAVYCAITGGEYEVAGSSGAKDEQGTCTFKTGKACDVWEYYQGECQP